MHRWRSRAAQKIIDGGKKGDVIKEKAKRYHRLIELPEAEKHIEEALENWPEQEERL